jgi:MATE family multidrug resistance protein
MALFKAINNFVNPDSNGLPGGIRRRRLFIPPSTNYPLFSYGTGDDQRSFLSLIESSSSVADDISDTASVSTSRSLPSTLSSLQNTTDQESFHSWLVEELHRRYSSTVENEYEDEVGTLSRLASVRSEQKHAEDLFNFRTSYVVEAKTLIRYSFPLIVTFVLEHFFSIVCLLVVGHLGKVELAAVSLATMTSTITFAIFEGTATALDTLCPQAYGAGNYELMAVQVQRCILMSWVVFIPCGLLWWNSGFFLKYIIASSEVVELTTKFLRILIVGAPAYIFFENGKRFLQAQGIFEAGTGILFVSAPLNIVASWFLVWNETYGIGYIGAPIVAAANFWLMATLMVIYVKYIDGSDCWFGIFPFNELTGGWYQLLRLAVPGVLMLESEYLAYEIMTLFASYFGTTELAAQSTVSSIASVTYMVPFAVGIAASTRIANFIGAQNIDAAKIASRTASLASIIAGSMNCVLLITFRFEIAKLFTKNPDVIVEVGDLFYPLVGVIQIFDAIASVSSGILRAQGAQKIGGIINLLAYYAFGLPLAFILCESLGLKLSGLWLGIGSGMIMIGVIETVYIYTSDWDKIIITVGLYDDISDDETSF